MKKFTILTALAGLVVFTGCRSYRGGTVDTYETSTGADTSASTWEMKNPVVQNTAPDWRNHPILRPTEGFYRPLPYFP